MFGQLRSTIVARQEIFFMRVIYPCKHLKNVYYLNIFKTKLDRDMGSSGKVISDL